MKPKIGIADSASETIAGILDATLADHFVLYAKTKGYHWNVEGPQFSELHKLFEAQAQELDEAIDAVAQRSRALGGRAPGSLAAFGKIARLHDDDGSPRPASAMIVALLADHEALIRVLRADVATVAEIGDEGTADFLTGLMEAHEKTAWMLRAHLDA